MNDKGDSKYCNCLYYSANALARVLTKLAEEEFAPTGLAPSYAFLLMTVNRKPGIQPMEIARHMQLAASTVTRLVEQMEHRGYLRREPEGRATRVYPTDSSLALDEQIRSCWRALFERYSAVIGREAGRELTAQVYQTARKLDD
ncbi:MarR family transcriptional regulator [candidate division KSB1 bacterium]|nr:MarR family transcriptional regulator [candidate division KSB1 bacterium]